MLKNFQRNSFLDTPVTDELMPNIIRYQNLEHAHRLLLYVLRRPDNDLKAPHIEPLLRVSKRVPEKYIAEFYAIVSGLIRALNHYIRMEESCTYSGKYAKDRAAALEQLDRILRQFEDAEDKREINYMAAMVD